MNAENIFDGFDDEELPLDCIESPFYADMRALFNIKLCELLQEFADGEFREGDINLKLSLSVPLDSEQIAQDDNDEGGQRQEPYTFRRPDAEYEAKLTLKRTSKDKGKSEDRRAFKCRDGRYIAVPVPTAQVTFDELQKHRVT